MSTAIKDWDASERPRERLARLGARHLTDAELLAIIIGSGSPDESAVGLMKRLLADHDGDLYRIGRLSVTELCRYKGIGEAKAISILAACGLGERRVRAKMGPRPVLDHAEAIYTYMRPTLRDLSHEECHVLLLNTRLNPLGTALIGKGGLTAATVDVREVLRQALLAGAATIVICHNHPSGNPQPGTADDRLTRRIKEAAALMDILLADHIVFADDSYYSYADHGRL